MRPVLAFDMNGTLLDLAAMDTLFQHHFGTRQVRNEWFMEMIELAMALTLMGQYEDFGSLGRSALRNVAERHGVSLAQAEQERLLLTAREAPAFPDVVPALTQLRDAGFRLAVLTNSPLAGARNALQKAGVSGLLEKILSVEAVRRYKPSPEVYTYGARELGVEPAGMMLVAAHWWDTMGAMSAGCDGAFLSRPGEVIPPVARQPRIIARDMHDLAKQLIG